MAKKMHQDQTKGLTGRPKLRAGVAALCLGALLAGCSTSRPGVSFEDKTASITKERPAIAEPPDLTVAGSSLDGLLRIALFDSPSVIESAAVIRQKTGDIDIAKAGYKPTINGGVTGGVGDADDPSFVLSATQLLFDFGRTDRSITRADLGAQEALLTFQDDATTVIGDVLTAYADYHRYDANVHVNEERLKRMNALADLIRQRQAAGATTQTDMLTAENSVQQAEHSLLEARSERDKAANQLREYAGPFATSLDVDLADVLGTCTPAEAPPDTLPDVALARLKIAEANLDVEDAKKARMPGIAAEVYGRQPVYQDGFRVGLNFNIMPTLFKGGALAAERQSANDALAAAQAGLDKTIRTTRLQALDAATAMANARQLIASSTRQAELLDKTRSLYRSQYFSLDTRSLNDVLDAEDDYYNAAIARSDSGRDLDVALVECHQVNGTLRSALGLSTLTLYGFPIDNFSIDTGASPAAKSAPRDGPPKPSEG